jgi:hypothetical protein
MALRRRLGLKVFVQSRFRQRSKAYSSSGLKDSKPQSELKLLANRTL